MEKPVRKAEFRDAGEGNGSIQSVVGGVTVGGRGSAVVKDNSEVPS